MLRQYGTSGQVVSVRKEQMTKVSNVNKRTENKATKNMVTSERTVKTLAIKCYSEQLIGGWEAFKERITEIDLSEYQVVAIKHDRDTKSDDYWNPSGVKVHYHILVRKMDSVTAISKNGIKVRTILNKLGIKFRDPDDKALLEHGALQTAKDFSNFLMYLTDETEEANQDGKERYDVSELVTNMLPEAIDRFRTDYVSSYERTKPSANDMVRLDREAEELGYKLGDYQEWYRRLSFQMRANSKTRQFIESYNYGADKRMLENDYKLRLCIFISGCADAGKTYTSEMTLKAMGYHNIVTIGGGGTGKYDSVVPSTECLLLDDDTLDNALNVSDNKICRLYKRNNNNPIWAGEMVVVTSNKSFNDWAKACKGVDKEHIEALRSRFYICHVEKTEDGTMKLICDSPSKRGKPEEQIKRKEMFLKFRDLFMRYILNYVKQDVDYSDLNDFSNLKKVV